MLSTILWLISDSLKVLFTALIILKLSLCNFKRKIISDPDSASSWICIVLSCGTSVFLLLIGWWKQTTPPAPACLLKHQGLIHEKLIFSHGAFTRALSSSPLHCTNTQSRPHEGGKEGGRGEHREGRGGETYMLRCSEVSDKSVLRT